MASGNGALLGLSAGVYALQVASLLPLRTFHEFSPLRLLAFPLFALSGSACMLRGAWLQAVRGSVVWRSREVSLRR